MINAEFCKGQVKLGLFSSLNWFHGLWSSFVIQDQKLYCCQFLPKGPVDQWTFLIADRAPMGIQKGWIWACLPPAIWCSEPVSRLMMIMYGSYLYPSYETVTKTYKLNYNETDRPTGLQWISDAALINTNLIIAGTTLEQLKGIGLYLLNSQKKLNNSS